MKRYPLLQSQMGVFAECIKNPDSAGYNLPYTCKLPDDTDMQRLKAAWEKLIARHRVFRTGLWCRAVSGRAAGIVSAAAQQADPGALLCKGHDFNHNVHHNPVLCKTQTKHSNHAK